MKKNSAKKIKKPLIIGSIVCFCLIFVSWMLNKYVFDGSSFCSSCHLIKAACDTWEKAQHKPEYTNYSCNACHLQPGIYGSLRTTALALENTYIYFFGIEEDDIKASEPINCTGCHPKMRESVTGKRVRVNHAFHMDMGYSCVVCHDRVAHEEYGMVKNLSMMTDFCFPCHDDEIAPRSRCSLCHIYQDNMLRGIETKGTSSGFISSHYQEDHTCQTCHLNFKKVDQTRCLDCHNGDIHKQYQRAIGEIGRKIGQIKSDMAEVEFRFTSTKGKGNEATREQLLSLYKEVQEDYSYLEKDSSMGAHNIKLTQRMVKNSAENIKKILYLLYNYQDYRYQEIVSTRK
ncbi:MAG: cytochrome c3 family protein [bacterium]